jgi:DNA-binding NtrC family response regulator
MALFTAEQRAAAADFAALTVCNPFRPERIALERRILGARYVPVSAVWSFRSDVPVPPNVPLLEQQAQELADTALAAWQGGAAPTTEDVRLYEDVVVYILFGRLADPFQAFLDAPPKPAPRFTLYDDFRRALHHYTAHAPDRLALPQEADHVFALCWQIRRAFHAIYRGLIGGSLPMAELRARLWESLFTYDLRRYRRALYQRLGDVPTLVTGPTGTGKDLVAQAIAAGQYLPFDATTRTFPATALHAVNLAALPPTLIESELFGHRRGAFTGAHDDKVGWLELCQPGEVVFLDEIGELDGALQVKLLRLLQNRTFYRLGETQERRFRGKLVAATNRDLVARIAEGAFRPDLFYRLCADQLRTVALADQLRDHPEELRHYLHALACRLVGDAEAPALATHAGDWIARHLGAGYAWPGNVRELEQCLRNLLIHNHYDPPASAAPAAGAALLAALAHGELTADELLRWYCTATYQHDPNLVHTAERLGLDRRTVKAKLDPELYARLPLPPR